jgi:hypothetical protein
MAKSDWVDGNTVHASDLNTLGTEVAAATAANAANTSAISAKQPLDADLTTIAGISPANNDVLQRKSGAWTNRTPAQLKTDLALAKGDVGLGNVDNTADTAKPVSTATQTALDLKAPLASPTFTGTVAGVTKTHVGLGNVDNTSDVNKPVSTATQTALDGKQPVDSDLTAIAALTTTSYGRSLLTGADAAATRTAIGVAAAVAGLVNVKDYGAAGDGTADDTAEIAAAITAAPSGGEVYFPPGTYKISSELTVGKPLRLYGAGLSSVLKLSAKASFFGLSSVSNVIIENLVFDGNRTALGFDFHTAIYMDDVADSSIRNCRFTDILGGAITITRGARIYITGNRFSNVYYSGVQLGDPTTGHYNDHIWISGNYLDTCQQSGSGGNAAIQTNGTGEVSHRYIHILNNSVNLPEVVGIGLDSIDLSNVTGNTVIKDATVSPGECIAFTGSENVVSDNYCHNDGISSGASILLYAVNGRTNDHNQIINNRCTNGGQGVGFTWGQTGAAINNLLIQGNHLYGNDRGVQSYKGGGVSSGSQSNVLISGNNLAGNTTEASNLLNDSSGITGSADDFANLGISPFP